MVKIILGLVIGGGLGALLGYYGKCTTGACPLTATPIRGMMYGAAMGLLLTMSLGSMSPSATNRGTENERVNSMNKENATMAVKFENAGDFENSVNNGITLVDFYADWCGPCRALAPTIDALSEKYSGRVTVGKVNVDEMRDLAGQFGISGIPAVIIFKDGREVKRITGLNRQSEYEKVLDELVDGVAAE